MSRKEFEERHPDDVEQENLPQTDTECPWCGDANLRAGPQLRTCPECPFSAKYNKDLADNPAYIIRAFADHQERQRFRAAESSPAGLDGAGESP